MSETSGWQKFVSTGRATWKLSLDRVREKLTRGVEVRVDEATVRRGDGIDVFVTITEPERLGELEVGLVCTEHYDVSVHSHEGGGTQRSTSTATEHETWQPVPSVRGEHRVRLSIPPHAPFSYTGDCLSFSWEVVARGRKERTLDARASHEIRVRP